MTKTKTISILVAVFVLSAFFTNCSKTAKKAQELTAFQLGYMNSTAHLLAFIAKEEGFFEEEGFNVTLLEINNTPELVTGLESGKLDVAFVGSVGSVTRQATGHDLTIFGGAMTNGHGYVLKTKYIPAGWKEGDITVFKGRTIATVKNTIQDYELLFLLKKNGIEVGEGPDKVNIVYFGSHVDSYSSLSSEQVDGAHVGSPYASIAKKQGHTVVYYCDKIKEFENQPCCRQVALTSALAANPDLYIAFERAMIKAYKFTQENHAKTIEDVAKYITIDKKDIDYEVYGGYALSHPDPDKKAMTLLKRGVVEIGFTNGVDYDIEKYYNTDIYRKALAQLLTKNPNDPVYKAMEEHFASAN